MSKRLIGGFLVPVAALAAVLITAGGAVSSGQEGVTGNNLSHPVIWGEPAILTLRGTYGVELWAGASFTIGEDPTIYWVNGDQSTWQAKSVEGYWVSPVKVTSIDWGDNLETIDWNVNSKVRVETVLFRALGLDVEEEEDALGETHTISDPNWLEMDGYNMYSDGGTKLDERFGTNSDERYYQGSQANVYSDHARLTIQLINPGQADQLVWDASAGIWIDSDTSDGNAVLRTDFNSGCWAGIAGASYYSAEINGSGKVIYGYNWDVRNTSNRTAGTYRLTFSLDPVAGDGVSHPSAASLLNTFFDGNTYIRPVVSTEGSEESVPAAGAGPGKGKGGGGGGGAPTKGGGTAYIVLEDKDGNPAYLTYIDVLIKAGKR